MIAHTDKTCRLLPWRVLSRLVTPPSNPPLMKTPLLKWYSRMTLRAFTSPVSGKTRPTCFHDVMDIKLFLQKVRCLEKCVHFVGVLTLEQIKVLSSEAIKGIVCWCKDGEGALLLQQISQACCLNEGQENPTVI